MSDVLVYALGRPCVFICPVYVYSLYSCYNNITLLHANRNQSGLKTTATTCLLAAQPRESIELFQYKNHCYLGRSQVIVMPYPSQPWNVERIPCRPSILDRMGIRIGNIVNTTAFISGSESSSNSSSLVSSTSNSSPVVSSSSSSASALRGGMGDSGKANRCLKFSNTVVIVKWTC